MDSCALCTQTLTQNCILEGEKSFCCAGCHAVFNILSSRNQLLNFHESPIFNQAIRYGLISNPSLLEQLNVKAKTEQTDETEKIHFEIADMWCPSCAEVIKLVLLQEKGINACVVDYSTDLAYVEFLPRFISKSQIFDLIKSLGYQPLNLALSERKAVQSSLYLRFILAAFCSLNVMMFAYPLYATYFHQDADGNASLLAWTSFYCSLPVLLYSAFPIYRRFLSSMRVGIWGMETLVTLGIFAAFGFSCYELWTGGNLVYFDSMTVIIVFVLLGKIIESKAKFSSKDSLLRLSRSLPRKGRKKLVDGSEVFVPLKSVVKGDTLIALSGEKIVLDGIVMEGEGSCDEALMTGESFPVQKKAKSLVIGGSILQNGWISYQVTHTLEESALQHILTMCEQEMDHKTVYTRAADKIVRWFVPVVLTFSFLSACSVFLMGEADPGRSLSATALMRAISIWLISCPCAIGIAAPLAEAQLINRLSALGVIVRNRGCLALLGKETAFVFDKTGTITEGRFKILKGIEELQENERKLLKAMASRSTHPISQAVFEAIVEDPVPLSQVAEMAGMGLKASYTGSSYYFGSSAFLRSNGIATKVSGLDMQPNTTTVYFAKDKELLSVLCLGDSLKSDASKTIQALWPVKTILLSGDSEESVKGVADACGFTSYQASCNPLQKRLAIDLLREKGETVCMLGDGINDAPALTGAHVSISVVNATDISIQVSDLLLTTTRLDVILKIRSLALKGQKIISQNLFWAFFYNVIGIGLAAYGVLTPLFAAFAMIMSSLMVIFNAKRI